jgi:Na+/H+ antiporter NhaB
LTPDPLAEAWNATWLLVAAFDLGIHRALQQTPLRAGILALLRIVGLTMRKPNWPATRNIFILLTAGRDWPVMAMMH